VLVGYGVMRVDDVPVQPNDSLTDAQPGGLSVIHVGALSSRGPLSGQLVVSILVGGLDTPRLVGGATDSCRVRMARRRIPCVKLRTVMSDARTTCICHDADHSHLRRGSLPKYAQYDSSWNGVDDWTRDQRGFYVLGLI